jgi:two-component system response regulator AtoC
LAAPPLRLLLVEDEPLEARLLKANLDRRGRVKVEVVSSAEEGLKRLEHERWDAILTDLALPGLDGIELVRRIREVDPTLPVILVTAYATLEKAVAGIRAGATEFLPKPVNVEALMALVERAVAERPLREELSALMGKRAGTAIEDAIVGAHPRLDEVRRFAHRIARVPTARVLITGESGTGKSILARAIHDLSGAGGRFVEVNCAALPADLLESELFGHEKGAFTDAKHLKRGLIELADQGTLFLNEIAAMPIELQAKLLLFLENQEIRRVGGTQWIGVAARIVAATNEDLQERVRERRFRPDLFYRLDVAAVEMPPLREMPSVIPELAARFVRDLCEQFRRPLPNLTERSFAALVSYPWPGNARELRNAVERALIFHDHGPLEVAAPSGSQSTPTRPGVMIGFDLTLEEVEQRYLAATLEASPGRLLEEIAQGLGVSRKTLWEKRRRHGL